MDSNNYAVEPNERPVRVIVLSCSRFEITLSSSPLSLEQVTDARDGQSRTVRQFQFTDWPEQGVPKSGEGFIDFIGQVRVVALMHARSSGVSGVNSLEIRIQGCWQMQE